MTSFIARQLGFAYGLHEASFELPPSGLITIAGPNGAGKSTLLGILAGLRSPYRGSCAYAGREVRQWPKREFARKVAFLPQSVRLEFPFTAEEVVLMGRTPYARGWFQTDEDRSAAEEAMTITDTLAFRGRDFRTLSGGEAQRVILASALTQRPEALLLDEPATHLDLRHQLSLYRLLGELAKSLLVVAVTHDLNLALQFSHRVMLLEDGRIAGDGSPREVLNPALIARVFGVQATVHGDARPWMTYEV
ncbi:MAG TPA: ABC transporter ATP-binding protein [Bryobacteraceae bacterium]|nr:ABC transporter ATP-binding protein [Bryobacteraceae bacterium]